MAYGRYPFPLVELIQALISESPGESPRESMDKRTQARLDTPTAVPLTPWLLCALLTLGETRLRMYTEHIGFTYIIRCFTFIFGP